MFKKMILKLLYLLSGNIDVLTEKFSYKNRRTRRAAARELVRLGYCEEGFKIAPKQMPFQKSEATWSDYFRKTGTGLRGVVSSAGKKIRSWMGHDPDNEDEKEEDESSRGKLSKTWTGLEQLEERVLLSGNPIDLQSADTDNTEVSLIAETRTESPDNTESPEEFLVQQAETIDLTPEELEHTIISGLSIEGEAEVVVKGALPDASDDYIGEVYSSDNNPEIESFLAVESTNIVVIDSAVEGYESLFADVPEGSEVFILDSDKDGLKQISDILASFENVDSLHILSHGSEGELALGSTVINSENLDEYNSLLESWKESLSEDADILLYGCDVSGDDAGISFVHDFAEVTGADIAASDDLTGAEVLGGDWDLEYTTGLIESEVITSETYQSTLAVLLNFNTFNDVSESTSTASVTELKINFNVDTLKIEKSGSNTKLSFTVGSTTKTISNLAALSDLTFTGTVADVSIDKSVKKKIAVSLAAAQTNGIVSTTNASTIEYQRTGGKDKFTIASVTVSGDQGDVTTLNATSGILLKPLLKMTAVDSVDVSKVASANIVTANGITFNSIKKVTSTSVMTVTTSAAEIELNGNKEIEVFDEITINSAGTVDASSAIGEVTFVVNDKAQDITFDAGTNATVIDLSNLSDTIKADYIDDSAGSTGIEKLKFVTEDARVFFDLSDVNANEQVKIVGGKSGDTFNLLEEVSTDNFRFFDFVILIEAGKGSDLITGSDLADNLSGDAGNDRISGGAGADTILGGKGEDILIGGAGSDHLQGGDNADTYRYEDDDFGDSEKVTDTSSKNKLDFNFITSDMTVTVNNTITASNGVSELFDTSFQPDATKFKTIQTSQGETTVKLEGDGSNWDGLSILGFGQTTLDFSAITADLVFTLSAFGTLTVSTGSLLTKKTIKAENIYSIIGGSGKNTFLMKAVDALPGPISVTDGATVEIKYDNSIKVSSSFSPFSIDRIADGLEIDLANNILPGVNYAGHSGAYLLGDNELSNVTATVNRLVGGNLIASIDDIISNNLVDFGITYLSGDGVETTLLYSIDDTLATGITFNQGTTLDNVFSGNETLDFSNSDQINLVYKKTDSFFSDEVTIFKKATSVTGTDTGSNELKFDFELGTFKGDYVIDKTVAAFNIFITELKKNTYYTISNEDSTTFSFDIAFDLTSSKIKIGAFTSDENTVEVNSDADSTNIHISSDSVIDVLDASDQSGNTTHVFTGGTYQAGSSTDFSYDAGENPEEETIADGEVNASFSGNQYIESHNLKDLDTVVANSESNTFLFGTDWGITENSLTGSTDYLNAISGRNNVTNIDTSRSTVLSDITYVDLTSASTDFKQKDLEYHHSYDLEDVNTGNNSITLSGDFTAFDNWTLALYNGTDLVTNGIEISSITTESGNSTIEFSQFIADLTFDKISFEKQVALTVTDAGTNKATIENASDFISGSNKYFLDDTEVSASLSGDEVTFSSGLEDDSRFVSVHTQTLSFSSSDDTANTFVVTGDQTDLIKVNSTFEVSETYLEKNDIDSAKVIKVEVRDGNTLIWVADPLDSVTKKVGETDVPGELEFTLDFLKSFTIEFEKSTFDSWKDFTLTDVDDGDDVKLGFSKVVSGNSVFITGNFAESLDDIGFSFKEKGITTSFSTKVGTLNSTEIQSTSFQLKVKGDFKDHLDANLFNNNTFTVEDDDGNDVSLTKTADASIYNAASTLVLDFRNVDRELKFNFSQNADGTTSLEVTQVADFLPNDLLRYFSVAGIGLDKFPSVEHSKLVFSNVDKNTVIYAGREENTFTALKDTKVEATIHGQTGLRSDMTKLAWDFVTSIVLDQEMPGLTVTNTVDYINLKLLEGRLNQSNLIKSYTNLHDQKFERFIGEINNISNIISGSSLNFVVGNGSYLFPFLEANQFKKQTGESTSDMFKRVFSSLTDFFVGDVIEINPRTPGLQLLAGLSGGDRYVLKGRLGLGAAIILETPDVEVGGVALPEAFDTLDLSGFSDDLYVRVVEFSLVEDIFAAFGEEYDFPLDISTNVVIASTSEDLFDFDFSDSLSLQEYLKVFKNLIIASDIENFNGGGGINHIRFEGDGNFRGVVKPSIGGKLVLDYTQYTGEDNRIVDGDNESGLSADLSAAGIDFNTETIFGDDLQAWINFSFNYAYGNAPGVSGSRLAGFDEIIIEAFDLDDGTSFADPRNWAVLNTQDVYGSQFDDTLTGNSLDNVFVTGGGADTIDGQGGTDFVSYQVTKSVEVTLSYSGSDTSVLLEDIVGSSSQERLENEVGDIASGDNSGDWTITLNGTEFTHTASAGDSAADITTAIAAIVLANLDVVIDLENETSYVIESRTEITGSESSTDLTVVTVNAVSETSKIDLSGLDNTVAGDWTVTVDGHQYTYAAAANEGLDSIAEELRNLIEADTATNNLTATYTTTNTFFEVSGTTGNERAFDVSVSNLASSAAISEENAFSDFHQTIDFTSLTPVEGDIWILDIDGTKFSYTVQESDTIQEIGDAFEALIDENADLDSTYAGDELTITNSSGNESNTFTSTFKSSIQTYTGTDLTSADVLVLDVSGRKYTFESSSTLSDVVSSINDLGITGVLATEVSGDIAFTQAADITLTLTALTASSDQTTLTDIEGGIGGGGDDLLISSSDNDHFGFAGEWYEFGNDTIVGFEVGDRLDFSRANLSESDLKFEKVGNFIEVSFKGDREGGKDYSNKIYIQTDAEVNDVERSAVYESLNILEQASRAVTDWFKERANDLGISAQRVAAEGSGGDSLTQAELDTIIDLAIDNWNLSSEFKDLVAIKIVDLSTFQIPDGETLIEQNDTNGFLVGLQLDGTILIDDDAAGHGWYTGVSDSVESGKVDLLSTVMHEIANMLGAEDSDEVADNVLNPIIPLGTRLDFDLSNTDESLDAGSVNILKDGIAQVADWLNDLGTKIDDTLSDVDDVFEKVPFTGTSLGGILGIEDDLGDTIKDKINEIATAITDISADSTLDVFDIPGISVVSFEDLKEFKADINLASFSESVELDPSAFNVDILTEMGLDISSFISFKGDPLEFDLNGTVDISFTFGLDESNNFFLRAPEISAGFTFGEDAVDIETLNNANQFVTLDGDQTNIFTAGNETYDISGSSSNDETYSVGDVVYDEDLDQTKVFLAEGIDTDDASGQLIGLSLDIVGVDTAAKKFILEGDKTGTALQFTDSIVISGSTGNDSTYTIDSITYNETEDVTEITVVEVIADEESDGEVQVAVDITATGGGADFIQLSGYHLDQFSDGDTIYFGGSNENDGEYTIASATFDQATNTTKITIEEEFAGADDSGRIRTTFDLGAAIGFINADLKNAAVGVDTKLSLGTDQTFSTADLTVENFTNFLGSIDFTVEGNFDIYTPIEISSDIGGLEIDPVILSASSPQVDSFSSIVSFLGNLSSLFPSDLDMSELAKFKSLSLDDLLNALEWSLTEFVGDADDEAAGRKMFSEVPLLKQTYADLLTFDGTNVIIEMRDAVADLRGSLDDINDFEDAVNDELRAVINGILGPDTFTDDLLFIEYADSVFEFGVDIVQIFEKTIDLDFSLSQLADDLDSPTLDAIIDLANDAGVEADLLLGDLDLSAEFNFDLGFGIDMSDILSPSIFMDADSGIGVELDASLNDFEAYFELFGLGMFGKNGELVIDLDLGLEIDGDADGDGRITLFTAGASDIGEGGDTFEMGAVVEGTAYLDLPLFFPIESLPMGGTAEDVNGDGIAENSLYMEATFSLDEGFEYSYNIPDFSMDFDIIGQLIREFDNPVTLLETIETFFDGVDDVADGFDAVDLPLIGGGPFDTLADALYGLRTDILGNKVGADYQNGLGKTIQDIGLPALTQNGTSLTEETDSSYQLIVANTSADITFSDGDTDVLVELSAIDDADEKASAIADAIKTLTGFNTTISGDGSAGDPWIIEVDASFFNAALNAMREALFDAFISLNESVNSDLFGFVVPVLDDEGFQQFDESGKLVTEALNSTDHTSDDIQLEFDPSGLITFNLMFGGTLVEGQQEIDFSTGIPGLNLSTDATLLAKIDYLMGIGLGLGNIGGDDGFEFGAYIDTSGVNQDGEEVALDIAAGIAVGDSIGATLGFLEVELTDVTEDTLLVDLGFDTNDDGLINASDQVMMGSRLVGHLGLDIIDEDNDGRWNVISETAEFEMNATVTAQADLFAELGTIAAQFLPSVNTTIRYDQVLGDFSMSSSGGASFEVGTPEVILEDVTLDVGSLFDSFLGDTFDVMSDVILPMKPVVDLLTFEIDLGITTIQMIDLAYLRLPAKTVDIAKKVLTVLEATIEFLETVDSLSDACAA